MTEAPEKNWVWRSTEESRATGKVSVLAVFETLVCVALYWILLLWFGVTWHHWMILIATPLVLLRSEQSVALGVRWFDTYTMQSAFPLRTAERSLLHLALLLTVCFVTGVLAVKWMPGSTRIEMFSKTIALGWLGMNIGVTLLSALTSASLAALITTALAASIPSAGGAAIAGATSVVGMVGSMAVAGALHSPTSAVIAAAIGTALATASAAAYVAAYGASVAAAGAAAAGVILLPGVWFGIWLRAILTRFVATARYPVFGFRQMPANWRYSSVVSDLFHLPELIPGVRRLNYGSSILSSSPSSGDKQKNAADFLFGLTTIPLFFAPVLLWRWSIKSTAWFYIPLLWAGRGWQRLDGEELIRWSKAHGSKYFNWASLILVSLALAGSLLSLFAPDEFLRLKQALEQSGAPITPLGYLMVLDWAQLGDQPWLWFYLPSYVLTIALFFMLDNEAKDISHGAAPRLGVLRFWMWVGNASAVLTNLGLAVALWYFLDAVNAGEKFTAFVSRLFAGLSGV